MAGMAYPDLGRIFGAGADGENGVDFFYPPLLDRGNARDAIIQRQQELAQQQQLRVQAAHRRAVVAQERAVAARLRAQERAIPAAGQGQDNNDFMQANNLFQPFAHDAQPLHLNNLGRHRQQQQGEAWPGFAFGQYAALPQGPQRRMPGAAQQANQQVRPHGQQDLHVRPVGDDPGFNGIEDLFPELNLPEVEMPGAFPQAQQPAGLRAARQLERRQRQQEQLEQRQHRQEELMERLERLQGRNEDRVLQLRQQMEERLRQAEERMRRPY